MTEQPFDFYKDLPEQQQNDFLRQYLIDTTHYLKPFLFPNSPGYFYYLPQFKDDAFHSNSITNLAALLMLLMHRDYLLPSRFNGGLRINMYFVFVSDVKELDEPYFVSFEYI